MSLCGVSVTIRDDLSMCVAILSANREMANVAAKAATEMWRGVSMAVINVPLTNLCGS